MPFDRAFAPAVGVGQPVTVFDSTDTKFEHQPARSVVVRADRVTVNGEFFAVRCLLGTGHSALLKPEPSGAWSGPVSPTL